MDRDMIVSWLKGRATQQDVILDADALQSVHGDQAYDLARRHAREAHKAHVHWDAVRREIGRRTQRSFLDTATRMLER